MRFQSLALVSTLAFAAGCASDRVGPTSADAAATFAYGGNTSNLADIWFQGFETDVVDWSSTTRVPTGTNGVASATGAFHGEAVVGAFSRFGTYRSVWPGDYVAEIDVYLDPAWGVGQGFDYSVASSGTDGAHRRDFIFHVGVVPDGRLLVNADNNTYPGGVNSFILMTGGDGTPLSVTSAGWYTLQHVLYDNGGVLAVDMNILNSAGTVLFTTTRSDPTDLIGVTVGGNRYGWFVVNTRTLAIDNHHLGTIVLLPGSKDDCKNGGWVAFGFRNQGLCIAAFNHS